MLQVELCVYPNVQLPVADLQWHFDHLVEGVYSISLYTDYKSVGAFTHIFMRHSLNGTHQPTTKVHLAAGALLVMRGLGIPRMQGISC